RIDWPESVIEAEGCRFSDVRVFPALLAPCRVDLIAGRAFSDVVRRFVLEDPEVTALAAVARKKAPELELILQPRHYNIYGLQAWPLGFGRDPVGVIHPDPERRGPVGALSDHFDPIEGVRAKQALSHRLLTLMTILRAGEVVGQAMIPLGGG